MPPNSAVWRCLTWCEDAQREEDGPVNYAGCGHRECITTGTAYMPMQSIRVVAVAPVGLPARKVAAGRRTGVGE